MSKLTKPKNMKLQIARRIVRKAFIVLFILFSFIVIFIAKPDSAIIAKTSGAVLNIAAPAIAFVSWPIRKIGALAADAQHFFSVDKRNTALEIEIAELKQQLARARAREREGEKLREACNFASNAEAWWLLTTRVIGASGGGFSHSYILDAGTSAGIERNQAVIAEGALVGQVAAAGSKYSRMLLLTDATSKIPVKVARTGVRAFLAGDNGTHPKAVHFESAGAAIVGDTIITSGMDGRIPAEIPVGVIGSISEEDGVAVQPFVSPVGLDFVKVVRTSRTEDLKEFIEQEASGAGK
ncbi:MAG: rod shape-determining protein MreC [Rickettsiales bacterium]|jgi:rod shape-determining protein MreC|nr:rod shape-determining protein MreC [Rickettsiales bacterium]